MPFLFVGTGFCSLTFDRVNHFEMSPGHFFAHSPFTAVVTDNQLATC
jgi:hypothetical protein